MLPTVQSLPVSVEPIHIEGRSPNRNGTQVRVGFFMVEPFLLPGLVR